jgi:hypothetical protein
LKLKLAFTHILDSVSGRLSKGLKKIEELFLIWRKHKVNSSSCDPSVQFDPDSTWRTNKL